MRDLELYSLRMLRRLYGVQFWTHEKSILACGLDRQASSLLGGDRNPAAPMPSHDNVRGADYYGHH